MDIVEPEAVRLIIRTTVRGLMNGLLSSPWSDVPRVLFMVNHLGFLNEAR